MFKESELGPAKQSLMTRAEICNLISEKSGLEYSGTAGRLRSAIKEGVICKEPNGKKFLVYMDEMEPFLVPKKYNRITKGKTEVLNPSNFDARVHSLYILTAFPEQYRDELKKGAKRHNCMVSDLVHKLASAKLEELLNNRDIFADCF